MHLRRVEDKLNAPDRPVPTDDHDAVIQLWTALIGCNGSGFLSQFKEFKDFVEDQLEGVVTKETCERIQGNRAKRKEKIERGIYLTVAIIGLIFGLKDFIIGWFQ